MGRKHSDSSVRFLHSLRDTTAKEPGVGPAGRGSEVGGRRQAVVRERAAGHQEVRELVVMYTVSPVTGKFILIVLWPQKVFCFWCINRFLTSGNLRGPQ